MEVGTLLAASVICGGVLLLRSTGWLQGWELGIGDQFFRGRSAEPPDDRIVMIEIDEADLRRLERWPMTDWDLAQLLQTVEAAQPRVIGLNLYRDLPVEPGHAELMRTIERMPNLIGVEQLPDQTSLGVNPPPVLKQQGRVGFDNILLDPDQKVRRSLLYWPTAGQSPPRESFSLKVALRYLEPLGIFPQAAPENSYYLKLGSAVFQQIQSDDGPYVGGDAGGYQVWVNFRRGATPFRKVSLFDVLEGKVPADWLRDRVVLIGSTATSLKDVSATPFNSHLDLRPRLMSGIDLQAQFISQILSATIDGRPLLRTGSKPLEWLWLWLWTWLGTGLCWHLRAPGRSILAIGGISLGVLGIGYGAFLLGWMIPVVPPVLGLIGSAALITSYIAHAEEELKRSTEFLHRVINTIPDPVYVKDKHHRWIVLNEAYAKFVGVSIVELLGQTVYDVFPKHEADVFWEQDERVFRREQEQETEEHLTNIHGITYCIATKRSLHKDAAGNLFLVGVIRDITHRKTIEAQLRRTTEELSKSNEELRQSQDRLSYLANHDILTGLPNRNLFYQKLKQALLWAHANQRQVALLFLDLDGFKQVNDSLGHAIGDQLLQSVAKRLTYCLRASDTVSRLGGDEFTVILPSVLGLQEVTRVADKILHVLAQPFSLEGNTVCVTTSIGISLYPHHTDSLETLIQLADSAMYQAKQAGKSQYAIAGEPSGNPTPTAPTIGSDPPRQKGQT